MTNEQAIKHLEVIKGDCALVGDIRALDMGISALSADVRENKHALWETNDRGIWCCPECGTEVYDGDSDQYCRKCGLDFKYTAHIQKMIKGEEGGGNEAAE